MALFNFFRKEEKSNNIPFQLSTNSPEPSLEEINEDVSVSEDKNSQIKPLTVSYATGWPIDIIYGYLHKNYEHKGYEDTMLNSNLTFRDMNMNIIIY